MAKMKGAIVVDTERCKGCQLCIIACPQKVIALANKVNLHGYPYVEAVNEEACVGCASCGIVCRDVSFASSPALRRSSPWPTK